MISQFFKKYSHVNWALADQAMVSGVNFLTGILFARFLGIEEFGRFTLVWMSVLFFNSIQMAMISAPMMSIGPKQEREELPTYYGTVIVQQLCFAVLSCILLWGGVKLSKSFYPDWQIDYLALPLATVVFFFQSQDFLRRFFFVRGRHIAAFANDATSYLGQIVILGCLFFTTTLDTAAVLWVIAITSAIACFGGAVFLGPIGWSGRCFMKTFCRHWQFSKWMTASALLQWTSGNFFIVTAGGVLGAAAVGAIKAAQNIMAVSHILFQGLENIVPVRASTYFYEYGVRRLFSYLRSVTLWGGAATSLLALLGLAFPEILLSLVYGQEYQNFAFVLRWYALIYIMIFLGLPLRIGLRTMEKTFPVFVSYGLMSLFSITSAIPFVMNFKLHGVMAGIFLVNSIMVATLYLSLRRARINHEE